MRAFVAGEKVLRTPGVAFTSFHKSILCESRDQGAPGLNGDGPAGAMTIGRLALAMLNFHGCEVRGFALRFE